MWYDHLPYLPFPDHWPVFSPKDKIAEVFVFSQKNRRFGTGESQDHFVHRTRIDLDDGGDVVAGGPKGRDDGEVAALVGEEPHRLVLVVDGAFADKNNLFVRKRIGRVAHRRVDVLTSEARVRVE